MNKLSWIVILMCLFITACEFVKEPQHIISFDKDAFERERAEWVKQGIHNYMMHEEIWNAIPRVIAKFTVLNDTISYVESINHHNREEYILTIPEVYNYVADFYNKYLQEIKNEQEDAELRIEITYNKEHHYPEQVHCMYFIWDHKGGVEPAGQGGPGDSILIKSFTSLE